MHGVEAGERFGNRPGAERGGQQGEQGFAVAVAVDHEPLFARGIGGASVAQVRREQKKTVGRGLVERRLIAAEDRGGEAVSSEGRRVGKEWVRTGRYRWSAYQ